MAYDINDADVAKFIRDEKAEQIARRGTGRWRPTAAGLKGIRATQGAFGLARPSFSPPDVSGLVGWYRSDRGIGINPSTNRLRLWQDLSYGGAPLVSFDPTKSTLDPPKLIANAWDGKPVVRFDRSNPNGEGLTTQLSPIDPPAFATGAVFVALNLNSLPGTGVQYRLTAGTSDVGGGTGRWITYIVNNGGPIVLQMFA